jgi:hypothetical protein
MRIPKKNKPELSKEHCVSALGVLVHLISLSAQSSF